MSLTPAVNVIVLLCFLPQVYRFPEDFDLEGHHDDSQHLSRVPSSRRCWAQCCTRRVIQLSFPTVR